MQKSDVMTDTSTFNPGSILRSIVGAREFGIFAFLVVAVVFIGVLRPNFLSANNIFNMGRQMAQITIMAVAMTYLITAQELDLSIGSVFGFCTLTMALLARDFGLDLWLALQGAAQPQAAASGSSSPYSDEEPLEIIFVTHDLGAGVFAPVRTGMDDACAMVNANCEFIGPQKYDPAEQVNLIEAAIARNPDAIVTTRPEPGTYNDVIQKAQEAGIMVVGFNTNDPTADETLPIPFVGQDFTNYGKVWARQAMEDLPEGGDIAITNCCFGHYALEERIRSFRETLEEEGGGQWTVHDVIDTGTDETEIFGVVEAYHQANPDIDAIYGVDYYSHVIGQYIKSNELQGDLKTGGSDMGPGNIEGIEEGYVSYGLGQNPYLQGFYPVMMVHLNKRFGIRPITIDTGTDVVTPENFSDYSPEYR